MRNNTELKIDSLMPLLIVFFLLTIGNIPDLLSMYIATNTITTVAIRDPIRPSTIARILAELSGSPDALSCTTSSENKSRNIIQNIKQQRMNHKTCMKHTDL